MTDRDGNDEKFDGRPKVYCEPGDPDLLLTALRREHGLSGRADIQKVEPQSVRLPGWPWR